MKTSIILLDEIRVNLTIEVDSFGQRTIPKAIVEFLDRPRLPHITLLPPRNGYLTPHFTAGNGRWAFREELARVKETTVQEFNDTFGDSMADEFAARLEPFGPRRGWTVHGLNRRVVQRWAHLARLRHDVRFDDETVSAVARHVLRNGARPSVLRDLKPARGARLVGIRWIDGRIAEVRAVIYFPTGCWVPGIAKPVHPPGWYSHGLSLEDILERALPTERLQEIGDQVLALLDRFRRRTPSAPHDQVEPWMSIIAGYYAPELLDAAIEATIAHASRPPSNG